MSTVFTVWGSLVSPSTRTCRAAWEGQHQLSTYQMDVRRSVRETGSQMLKLLQKTHHICTRRKEASAVVSEVPKRLPCRITFYRWWVTSARLEIWRCRDLLEGAELTTLLFEEDAKTPVKTALQCFGGSWPEAQETRIDVGSWSASCGIKWEEHWSSGTLVFLGLFAASDCQQALNVWW